MTYLLAVAALLAVAGVSGEWLPMVEVCGAYCLGLAIGGIGR